MGRRSRCTLLSGGDRTPPGRKTAEDVMARTAAQAVFDPLALHRVERLYCAPGVGLQKVKR
jgi:hypothetical protein